MVYPFMLVIKQYELPTWPDEQYGSMPCTWTQIANHCIGKQPFFNIEKWSNFTRCIITIWSLVD